MQLSNNGTLRWLIASTLAAACTQADGDKDDDRDDASAMKDADTGDAGSCDCGRDAYVPVCGGDGKSYDATCGRHCVPVSIACDGECPCTAAGGLRWYLSCGDPVCRNDGPFDSPNIANCGAGQSMGASCDVADARCDGVASCGATLVCSKEDPTLRPGGCPISRARFKQDIAYLDAQALRAYHEQLMRLSLASYRYKHAPDAGPQLGFIIDDAAPSVAVQGDHVNLYGYLSMAVAAIQVQQREIEALERELERLRAQSKGRRKTAPRLEHHQR